MATAREVRLIAGVEHFKCTGKCNEWLPRDRFYGCSHTKHGITSQCKLCKNSRKKAVYASKVRAPGVPRHCRPTVRQQAEQRELDARWARRLAENPWMRAKRPPVPVLIETTLQRKRPVARHYANARRPEVV